MYRVRNISKEPQAFTGHPEFAVNESRPITAAEAEIFKRSPFMAVEEDTKQPKAKTLKAIE